MSSFRNYNNVITICGAGRNVGKTFLGESIIAHFSKSKTIVAIKISKYKHKSSDKIGMKILFESDFFTIYSETNFTHKDSGRYLKAGAKASYYIECDDAHLLDAFLFVYKIYTNSCLIVCESASITKYMNPAISVFVESTSYATEENKLDCLLRSTIILKEKSIEISLPQLFLSIQNNIWPGNIRELKNIAERMVILASNDETIGLKHIPPEIKNDSFFSNSKYNRNPAPGRNLIRN